MERKRDQEGANGRVSYFPDHSIGVNPPGCPSPLQNQREQNYTVLKTRSNMMTVEGLKPGTTYVFRVRARTDGGYGSYGGEIELETSHEGEKGTAVNCLGEPMSSFTLIRHPSISPMC